MGAVRCDAEGTAYVQEEGRAINRWVSASAGVAESCSERRVSVHHSDGREEKAHRKVARDLYHCTRAEGADVRGEEERSAGEVLSDPDDAVVARVF